MKIGILGCGYVGKALLSQFKQTGNQVFATTRKSERVAELGSISHHVHLLKQEADYIAFMKDLTILIICVAPDSSSDYRSTYLGTIKQVTQLLSKSPSLQQIIYTSSSSVYGEYQGEWVDENTTCKPLNENGQILLEAENQLLNAMTDHLNICIFRLGEIFGPGRLIEQRLKNSTRKFYPGDGNQYTNLIHLEEIVQAIDLAIQKQLRGIYNLCNDFHMTRKAFYEMLCDKFNIPAIQWDKELSSPHGGNKRVSNQKLKNSGLHFNRT